MAGFEVITEATWRRTTHFYQEDAFDDGIYPWKTTNAMGHPTTVRRHPGLGLAVEVVDPNGIAAAQTYDTFGRLRFETDFSGATTRITHPDNAGTGADILVDPAGLTSRRITIHVDAFGQETLRETPITSTRRVRVNSGYDALGRLKPLELSHLFVGGSTY